MILHIKERAKVFVFLPEKSIFSKTHSMKKTIGKLRIAALVCFALFIISVYVGFSDPSKFKFSQFQSVLILVSFVLFLLIIILQLYGLYINSYLHDEGEDSSSS